MEFTEVNKQTVLASAGICQLHKEKSYFRV